MNTSPTKNLGTSSSSLLVDRGIHLLYRYLLGPRVVHEKDERKQFILTIILLGTLAISLLLEASIIYKHFTVGEERPNTSIWAFGVVCLYFIGLLFLTRIRKIRLATFLLIAFCLVFTIYSQCRWGVSLPAGLLGHALIITISTILLGPAWGVGMSLFIGAALITLSLREQHLQIVALWKSTPVTISTGIQHAFILFIITILSCLYFYEIERALKKALKSEQALQEKNESLEQIVEERTKALKLAQVEKNVQLYRFVEFGKLSAGIFHDILNPLTVVAVSVESLQSTIHNELPEIKKDITRAVLASKKMERFISSVKKQILLNDTLSEFSINTEIEEVILLFGYKAKKSNVVLEFIADENINFFGNASKFNQIVSNLISNAVDAYTHPQYHTRSHKTVSISLKRKGNHLEIYLKDHGIGISDKILGKIFEPFFTTKSNEGLGIGLGLSTTKHLIEKNFNGTIRIQSKLGEGTICVVSLPFKHTPNNHLS